MPGPDDREILWRQYALHADLYKHYMKVAIELNVFFYAVTGAILSYYFAPKVGGTVSRWALVLPLGMSIGLGLLFTWGATQIGAVRNEVFAIRDRLGLFVAPEMRSLTAMLIIFGVLCLLTACGIAAVLLLGIAATACPV